MYELRYLVRNGWDGPEQVLQYRTRIEISDYSAIDHNTGGFIRRTEWTDWRDVPTVDETK